MAGIRAAHDQHARDCLAAGMEAMKAACVEATVNQEGEFLAADGYRHRMFGYRACTEDTSRALCAISVRALVDKLMQEAGNADEG